MDSFTDHLRYLNHLAKEFPSQEAAAEAIINLKAQLDLPKGTEHFISDIHGEYEAFSRVVSHASGSIKRKIGEIFGDDLSIQAQLELGAHGVREHGSNRAERTPLEMNGDDIGKSHDH